MYEFIRSRPEYCNSLLSGTTDGLLRQLQSVKNAAASLFTITRKVDQIKPVLRGLHQLLVRQRLTFKIALLVYKCLHGHVPSYLAELSQPVTGIAGRQRLRSVVNGALFVPTTRTVFGASLSKALLSGMVYLPTYCLPTSRPQSTQTVLRLTCLTTCDGCPQRI
jgi:hypothetical protein